MKIKFITEEGLLTAKGNYSTIYKEVIKKSNNICNVLNDSSVIKESSIEIEDFSFDMSQEKAVNTDLENIRRVYNHMKGLSESQASDERIWVAFTLNQGLDYMKYRWMPESESDKIDRFFFKTANSKRPLFRNGIARLWWIGYHTYDSKRINPYELTEFICKDQDYINNLLDIGFASNPKITKAVISAVVDAEKQGAKINREVVRSVSQYVNLLGGIYILDCLSYDEIYEKVTNHIGL
ncbi:MAG: hypothetical protein K6F64_10065 [Clostridia bacterium]|nr:hypothetical protein [Clostridia bacterium]